MNLFLDIETSGLIPKGKGWEHDYKEFPYVASIAWKINNRLSHYIVHDTNYVMSKELTKIHGITNDMLHRSTTNLREVCGLLAKDLIFAEKIIGHNIHFDTSIIKANAKRYFPNCIEFDHMVKGLDKEKRICTMRAAQPLMGGRWKSLQELHMKLFKKRFSNAHSADADVEALERCFNKLKQMRYV